ncbi:MAG: hypothetical protein ACYDB7_06770 [Mycobacteriales bacterium]
MTTQGRGNALGVSASERTPVALVWKPGGEEALAYRPDVGPWPLAPPVRPLPAPLAWPLRHTRVVVVDADESASWWPA